MIKSILLLFISTILIVKSQQSGEYLNFIPHTDPSCTQLSGRGYSGLLDACFSLDTLNCYAFKRVGSNQVSITGYYHTECGVNGTVAWKTRLYQEGSCVSSKLLTNFNGAYLPINNTPIYYKLNISSIPIIPSNSYTSVQSYSECTNENYMQNAVITEYFTNGTLYYFGTQMETIFFFCSKIGHAKATECSTIKKPYCFTSVFQQICHPTSPFFNSSSDADSSYYTNDSGDDLFSIKIINDNYPSLGGGTGTRELNIIAKKEIKKGKPYYFNSVFCTPV